MAMVCFPCSVSHNLNPRKHTHWALTMKSLITMMPSFIISRTIFFLCILSLVSLNKTKAAPTFRDISCLNTTTYTPNSTYQSNLNNLFSLLSSNSTAINGFYNSTAGHSPPDKAYGIFLCRGDLSTNDCQDCVAAITKDVVQRCPKSKIVSIWYDECMLHYSNQSMFSILDQSVRRMLHNVENTTEPNRFKVVLGNLMNVVATEASASASNSLSGKKFATRQVDFSALQKLYGLAQCTPDITSSDCNKCLRDAIAGFPICCDLARGGRVMYPSCNVRFETYPFYTAAAAAAPAPPPAPLPVLPPPPPASTPGKGGISSQVLIATIVSIGVFVLLIIIGLCFLRKKAKKQYDAIEENNVGNETTDVESLQYDFGTIQVATNNFSNDNKVGEGGFGQVYKGTLLNGQQIAVKRLSRNSTQGAKEFMNEAVLIAKLQHRNLVRLLGFCLEGEEKILIYEFVPNKSLDHFVFDSQEQEKLDWSRRYNIIRGIARGMLYLHEDCQLTIIHRDLKASNILLDGAMNAKISDFGMARIFDINQTQGNTSRVVGTYGYMSPEYAMHGQFSVKSDVFSFGVLVLEIISGKKINDFDESNSDEDLLSNAWKLWRDGTPLDLMDRTLEVSHSSNEVTRCINIGLLCVQEDPDARPSMATVVLMLDSYSVTMSIPQQPAFFLHSRTKTNIGQSLELDKSTSKSMPLSVNEVSITELHPR